MANQQPNGQWGVTENFQGDVAGMQRKMAELESTLQGLLREKQTQEADFAHKRAQFKELFLQREDELIKEAENLRKEKERMEAELNDVKTTAIIAEQTYREEVDEVRQQWKGEVGSMQQIMTNAVALTTEETAVTYEKERDMLLAANEQLTQEIQDLQERYSDRSQGAGAGLLAGSGLKDKPEGSLLTNVTRSIRSWSNTTSPMKDDGKTDKQQDLSEEDLENSMLKAQQDTELLRAVVVPLEQEIESLKAKLKDALQGKLNPAQLDALCGITTVDSASATPPEGDQTDMDEKMKELNHVLETEKSSRSDLELYVAVLNKQKSVYQDDADKFHKELKDVCRLLEVEKQEHQQLKNTWHMANDQFLESQRLQMMDMRRMEKVLSEEQQRQILELQKKDREREEQENRVRELTKLREKASREQEEMKAQQIRQSSDPQDIPSIPGVQASKSHSHKFGTDSPITSGSSSSTTKTSPQTMGIPNVDPDDLLQFESFGPSPAAGVGNAPLHRSISEIAAHSFADSAVQGMEGDAVSLTSSFSLTEAQEKAIASDTPETAEIKSVLASARSKSEDFPSLAGKRVVSETEWLRLMEEVKNAREKLGRPCDMCSNYELQLQTVQSNEQEVKELLHTLSQELEQNKTKISNEQRLRSELEESLKNAAEDAQSQIIIASNKNKESENFLTDLRQGYLRAQNEMHDQLEMLLTSREAVYKEVQRLQEENESLSAKRTLHTSIVRGEDFQLPNTINDVQRLCVKYREDIITIKVNSEHTEESLRNEIGFLKNQLKAEQHTKNTLEETYQTELDESKEELIILRSFKDAYEHEKKLREETESKLEEVSEAKKSFETSHEEKTNSLKLEIDELTRIKCKLEQDQRESRNQSQSLQVELENSEATQRDFVMLSQSLQVQLENIRQKDNEVRWQHEDDADKCSGCKTTFGSSRRKKQHCKHCCRIFCPDCLTKHVESGPRRRRMPVCNVCHTLLVNESAPYFSEEAPMTT